MASPPEVPSDSELIARVLVRDDRSAFGELVARHQSAVRGLARRLTGGDLAQADDLAQETFLRAYRGLRGYRGGAKFSSWLYRIACNVFFSRDRGSREAPVELPALEAGSPEGVSLPDALLERYDLERALASLKPRERAALVLTYANELTHEEAAVVLDCPLGTLKTHVARAKEKLRRQLEEVP
ncbi:RNA polymerase sigma factor [Vitiosangium sp. GDMCC 1.1324]|uniref:RNA polymerase sigma factor n=1 Tax=Vitiosangium sp. (strain GDMCC 1.1324) TaxID=2138576 RepID=UPI000D3975F0|nr:RNA polymerase sigma factor [Vitiosangium sp. GDMCC 1.1324]PTL80604.1 RNA polymerase subunit sigma-24 [Vitiosangium sp. GDMCC 1.1324]